MSSTTVTESRFYNSIRGLLEHLGLPSW